MKRLLLLMAALLACGLIAAGCGDDDDDTGGDDSPAVTETAPADSTDTDAADAEEEAGAPKGEEEGDSGDAPAPSDEVVEQAVDACKQAVQTSGSQLSGELKKDLEEICEEAASGDQDDVRKASLEICKKIVEESVPAGPAREQAISSCEESVPTP